MIEAGSLPEIFAKARGETWLTLVPKALKRAEDAVRQTIWIQQRRTPAWPRNERPNEEIAGHPKTFRSAGDWHRFLHGLHDLAGLIVRGSVSIDADARLVTVLLALRKSVRADLRLLRQAARMGNTWPGTAAIWELRKKQGRSRRTTRDGRLVFIRFKSGRKQAVTAWPASKVQRISPTGYAVRECRLSRARAEIARIIGVAREVRPEWVGQLSPYKLDQLGGVKNVDGGFWDKRRLPSLAFISKRSLREHDARDRTRVVFFGYHYLVCENGYRWAAIVPDKNPSAWATKHIEQPALLLSARREETRRRADAAVCGLLSNFGFVG
jgi:hypothetical protein